MSEHTNWLAAPPGVIVQAPPRARVQVVLVAALAVVTLAADGLAGFGFYQQQDANRLRADLAAMHTEAIRAAAPTPNKRRGIPMSSDKRWIVGGVLAALALAGCSSGTGEAVGGTHHSKTKLAQALADCNVTSGSSAALGDAGKTLTLDGQGKKDSASVGLSVSDEACILNAVHVSDAIISEMDSTTAMMGRQQGEWDGFKATWTYHPDNGLDVIIQDVG